MKHRTSNALSVAVLLLLGVVGDAVSDVSSKLRTVRRTGRGGGGSSEATAPASGGGGLSLLDLAVAGSVATMIGDAALHPVDCLKTLQQSNEGAGLSLLGAGRQIYRTSGVGGFYSGLGTYVAGDGGAGAVKFATYEFLKRWVNDHVDEDRVGAALFGCAALAFVASSVVLVPGELIKQRLQMGQYASLKEAVSSIWTNEGLFGFYAGYSGVCLRDVPYTMMELGLYDNFKSLWLRLKNRNRSSEDGPAPITQMDEIVAAGITGGITGYLSNPLDLIKTKLMVDGDLYTGFFDAFRKTVSEGGLSSLFQGGAARVAWLLPFTAIYLPVYDLFKRRIETYKTSRSSTTALKLKGGAQRPSSTRTTTTEEEERPSRRCFERHPLQQSRAFFSF